MEAVLERRPAWQQAHPMWLPVRISREVNCTPCESSPYRTKNVINQLPVHLVPAQSVRPSKFGTIDKFADCIEGEIVQTREISLADSGSCSSILRKPCIFLLTMSTDCASISFWLEYTWLVSFFRFRWSTTEPKENKLGVRET